MSTTIFIEIIILLSVAVTGGVIARYLRFPLTTGYIISGLIVGYFTNLSGFSWFTVISSILLFSIGSSFQSGIFSRPHVKSLATGLILQFVIIMALLPFLMLFNFSLQSALMLALLFSLPSVIITTEVVRAGGINTFEERQFYIFSWTQLFIFLPLIYFLPVNLSIKDTPQQILLMYAWDIIRFFGIFIISFVIGRRVIPFIFSMLHKYPSQELVLVVNSLLVTASMYFFYSTEVVLPLAAFFCGVILSIANKKTPDHFKSLQILAQMIFFVFIATQFQYHFFQEHWWTVIAIFFIIIVIKFFSQYFTLRNTGYFNHQAAFISGNLSHIGEFSIIISVFALQSTFSDLTPIIFSVAVISLAFFPFEKKLLPYFSKALGRNTLITRVFGKEKNVKSGLLTMDIENHVVILGFSKVGDEVRKMLEYSNVQCVVVDTNINREEFQIKHKIIIGDPTDRQIIQSANIEKSRAAVVTVEDFISQKKIIDYILSLNPRIKIICQSSDETVKFDLANLGVNSIVIPEFEAGMRIGREVLTLFNVPENHINEFSKRLRREYFLK